MKHIYEAAKKHKERMLKAERYIWNNPETGFKEIKTTAYLAKELESLGYELTYAENIPGFYTVFDTGLPGPEIMVMCELDSIICPDHPEADPETGAAHACGHNCQSAALVGIAAALKEPGVTEGLCGRIRLCGVPAEELVETDFRKQMIEQGVIRHLSGKMEFLDRGYFDGVDIALIIHAAPDCTLFPGNNGVISKQIAYKGKAAHAGGSPWLGHNALYAATCGLNAINAIRETFHDTDLIRVHPIITHGGDIVGTIPDNVTVETFVRGQNLAAISAANKKVNQALTGAAISLNCNIEIKDIITVPPFINAPDMMELCIEAFHKALPSRKLDIIPNYSTAGTDSAVLSCLMPIVQPYCGGTTGASHGSDYCVADPEAVVVDSAIWQLTMIRMLLENDAKRAKEIKQNFKPLFASKEEYFAHMESMSFKGNRIQYNGDTAEVHL